MWRIVEPRVRRLVAEHLGVTEDELSPELSLVEDLAADSLDFAELGLAVEEELDVAVPDDVLDAGRTYCDLVEATVGLGSAQRAASPPPTTFPMPYAPMVIWSRQPSDWRARGSRPPHRRSQSSRACGDRP